MTRKAAISLPSSIIWGISACRLQHDHPRRKAMATILIVDDDKPMRETLVEFLELEGHDCKGAPNGLDARLLINDNPPEIVISDVNMPVESGIDLLRFVSQHYPSVTFILMTGAYDAAAVKAAMQLGTHAYVIKPFRLMDLLEIVNSFLLRTPQAFMPLPSEGYTYCTT
jgi:DNA-binding NtrC family response regulator